MIKHGQIKSCTNSVVIKMNRPGKLQELREGILVRGRLGAKNFPRISGLRASFALTALG
jgi:hypothetical protein